MDDVNGAGGGHNNSELNGNSHTEDIQGTLNVFPGGRDPRQ